MACSYLGKFLDSVLGVKPNALPMQSTRKVQARLVSRCLCRCGCVEDAVQQIVKKKPSFINKHIFWHFLTFSIFLEIWPRQVKRPNHKWQSVSKMPKGSSCMTSLSGSGCVWMCHRCHRQLYNFIQLHYTYILYLLYLLYLLYIYCILLIIAYSRCNSLESESIRTPPPPKAAAESQGLKGWRQRTRETSWKMLKDVESLRIFLPRQQL